MVVWEKAGYTSDMYRWKCFEHMKIMEWCSFGSNIRTKKGNLYSNINNIHIANEMIWKISRKLKLLYTVYWKKFENSITEWCVEAIVDFKQIKYGSHSMPENGSLKCSFT